MPAVPPILSFEDAITASSARKKVVLLGNGFSIAQSGGQFSYSNLLERCGLARDEPVRNVFNVLSTVDFEEVIHALEHAAKIEAAYGDAGKSQKFQVDATLVRAALIHAIRAVHPNIQFDVPEAQRNACAAFLSRFELIFTLNYDLLLYWTILHAARQHTDGFAFGDEIDGFRTFNEGAPCSTHYLHGALHLFCNDELETQKRIVTNYTIIDDITETIRSHGRLPLFVAEGTTTQKKGRINSVPYLRYCYDKLANIEGSLFVYGHSAQPNDHHIYDAIFNSSIDKVFFCVHRPERKWGGLRERLAPFAERNPNIEIVYVDAGTVSLWR